MLQKQTLWQKIKRKLKWLWDYILDGASGRTGR